MKVSPDTKIRVAAVNVGNYVGLDGDIIVCNPEGVDPLARYPRIKAKDVQAGILAGLISLDVDPDRLKFSDDAGNLHEARIAEQKAEIADVDLSALADLEAKTSGEGDVILGNDMIARPVSALTEVSIGKAVVEGDDGKLVTEEPQIYAKHKAGGVFQVFAPWLDDPIEVRAADGKSGKEVAEEEVARLKAEGPPPIV